MKKRALRGIQLLGARMWNENDIVLLSLLTTSGNLSNLEKMANGLMARYKKAKVSPPHLLYTDWDCYKIDGPSKFSTSFSNGQI